MNASITNTGTSSKLSVKLLDETTRAHGKEDTDTDMDTDTDICLM